MKRHGTEYRHRPTLTWMSGPTVARDQVASTNRRCGKGFSSLASTAANTLRGAALHAGAQVVRHQPGRYPTEERERLHMRLRPRGLIHPQHRAHEHVPRTG